MSAFVAEEQALGDVGPNGVLRAFKTACTYIEARPTSLWQQNRLSNLLLPLPRLVLSAVPKGWGCGGMIAREFVLGRYMMCESLKREVFHGG